jgi:beta-galactosidase
VLRLHWTGDVGRAYLGGRLIADQFFSGRVWDIGRLPAGAVLRVKVLPLHPDARVYVPDEAAGASGKAAVTRAEWITNRTWTVRAG